MNPIDRNDRILNELLASRAALDAMRAAGLASLRRRRWQRRAQLSTAAAAIVALFYGIAHLPRRSIESPKEWTAPLIVETPILAPAVRELTDDELLREFPAGTCTFVEINGQKTLVFLSDQLQAKYLR